MESGLDEGLLFESQGLFRIVLENMLDPLFVTDDDGRFVFICANIATVLGYTVEEVAAAGTMTRFLGRELFSAAELEAGRELANIECPVAKKDGTKRDFLVTVKRVSIGRGTVLYVCRDVTERKEAELRLENSEKRMRLALEASQIGLWDWDVKSDQWYASPTYYTMLGYEPRSGPGDRGEWLERVHPDDRAEVAGKIQKVRTEDFVSYEYEARMRHADGVYHWVSVAGYGVTRDPEGSLARLVGIRQDITERKQAEEAQKTSQAQLEAAMDLADLVSWEFDAESELFTFNDRFYALYGTTAEIEGGYQMPADEYVRRFIHPDDHRVFVEGAEKAMGTTEPNYRAYLEHRVMRRDREVRHINVRFVVTKDEQGRTIKTNGANQDITERKQAEAERLQLERRLQQSQRLESLGVLAGGIAHDFNNILMSVLGNAELALTILSPSAPARENLLEITASSRRAADLCRQMLAYSGRGHFVTEAIDLQALIEDMLGLLQSTVSKKALLNLNMGKNLPPMRGDVSQLSQVIMNLVINASEAIGERSGVITISTGVTECTGEYLERTYGEGNLAPGLYLTLEVSDTGAGMDKATQERIFEPFFTTKFTGRGLGLSAILGIVRGHKGALRLYSELGKGTTFKILFPVSETAAESLARANGATKDDWQGAGTILLVDDEETIRTLGVRMLASLGFTVITAADGREALAVYAEHRDEITLVLLDLTMPHMDGEQTFRELRLIAPGVRVVMSSGYAQNDIAARFAGKGLVGFVHKPYSLAELRDQLRAALEGIEPGSGTAGT